MISLPVLTIACLGSFFAGVVATFTFAVWLGKRNAPSIPIDNELLSATNHQKRYELWSDAMRSRAVKR